MDLLREDVIEKQTDETLPKPVANPSVYGKSEGNVRALEPGIVAAARHPGRSAIPAASAQ